LKISITDSNQLWQARKTKTSIWKLEIMSPLGNVNLNKILKTITHMFMKQNCGQAFQPFKGCFALIGIRCYKLNKEVSNIVTHGKGKEADVPRLMFNGIFV